MKSVGILVGWCRVYLGVYIRCLCSRVGVMGLLGGLLFVLECAVDGVSRVAPLP